MKDRTYNFLCKYFGVYKIRIRLGLSLTAIYVISILFLMFKISLLPAFIITPIFIIENIIMIIFDAESFERKYPRRL